MSPEPSHLPEPPTLPIKDLRQFLGEARKLFDNVVYQWVPLLFEEEFRHRLRAAWRELRPKIPAWQAEVDSPAHEGGFQNAGLRGAQLDLKLEGVNSAWKRFKSRGTVGLLRKVLGWINAILGSLAQVIPGVEALRELKEAIERLIAGDEA